MSRLRLSISSFAVVYVLSSILLILIPGCGRSSELPVALTAAETGCKSGSAQILVGDGYLQNLCGCTGPGEERSIYPTPSKLICHLTDQHSILFFHYIGSVLKHQIVSTGDIGFTPSLSPLSDPKDPFSVQAYAVAFPAPATVYRFEDFYSGMTGDIIVP